MPAARDTDAAISVLPPSEHSILLPTSVQGQEEKEISTIATISLADEARTPRPVVSGTTTSGHVVATNDDYQDDLEDGQKNCLDSSEQDAAEKAAQGSRTTPTLMLNSEEMMSTTKKSSSYPPHPVDVLPPTNVAVDVKDFASSGSSQFSQAAGQAAVVDDDMINKADLTDANGDDIDTMNTCEAVDSQADASAADTAKPAVPIDADGKADVTAAAGAASHDDLVSSAVSHSGKSNCHADSLSSKLSSPEEKICSAEAMITDASTCQKVPSAGLRGRRRLVKNGFQTPEILPGAGQVADVDAEDDGEGCAVRAPVGSDIEKIKNDSVTAPKSGPFSSSSKSVSVINSSTDNSKSIDDSSFNVQITRDADARTISNTDVDNTQQEPIMTMNKTTIIPSDEESPLSFSQNPTLVMTSAEAAKQATGEHSPPSNDFEESKTKEQLQAADLAVIAARDETIIPEVLTKVIKKLTFEQHAITKVG